MVDSSFKFLLKEKDSREIEPFPSATFFFLIPNLIIDFNQHTSVGINSNSKTFLINDRTR
jgi:hypothetical protein